MVGIVSLAVSAVLWAGWGEVPPALGAPRAPQAMGWIDRGARTIPELAARLAPQQVLLVEVSAVWCAPCHQLANEILDTPAAAAIVAGDVGVRVDFDSDYGQLVKRMYGVLQVPALLVIDHEGREIGRVEGYAQAADWTEAVRDARAGGAGLAALAARQQAAPEDLELGIAVAQAQLVRGDEATALAALDAIIARSDVAPGPAAHAARVKGRWLLRVREDAPRGRAHFEAMMVRFAGRPDDWRQFLYWAAAACHAQKDDAGALALFASWRKSQPRGQPANGPDGPARTFALEPEALAPLEDQADFMVFHTFAASESEPVVRELLLRAPDGANGYYLLAQVLRQKRDLAGARAAIARAVALEPGAAMYANYQRRLGGAR